MSILQYPNGINPKDVHIWNNAAFDSQNDHANSAEKKPILIMNSIDSLESFSSKENQSPPSLGFNSSVSSDNSQRPLKPINPNGVLQISKPNSKRVNQVRDEKDIDKEIEEIEMEMNRLASRLEALRILKAQKSVKVTEKKGKMVSSKFMEQNHDPPEGKKKIEESVLMSSKLKLDRRGRSLGPVEISAMKPKQSGKQDSSITLLQPIQNRRKSCFWKLEDIDEEKKSRGQGKVEVMRQAVTTSTGGKKCVKIDDGVISSVQPKKLFGNGEKSVLSASAKKPMRQGRVVASRYNQISNQPGSAIRKRSLADNDKDESKRCEKKRSGSFEEKKNVDSESRIKKRWEIPREIVIHGNYEEEESPKSVNVVQHKLPKLRVRRCAKESPRNSGPAKKVAELIGRKTFFTSDEEMEEATVCQALSFAEEGDEE